MMEMDEQLTGANQEMPLPQTAWNGWTAGDLLDRLTATDRLHGNTALELGPEGKALAHRWELRSGVIPRRRVKQWELSRKTRTNQCDTLIMGFAIY